MGADACRGNGSVTVRIACSFVLMMMLVSCAKHPDIATTSAKRDDDASFNRKARKGAEIFHSREFGAVPIACADCHTVSVKKSDDLNGMILAGHSLISAHLRSSGWNGEFTGDTLQRVAMGAAKCASIYQLRSEELEDALRNAEANALMEFFKAITSDSARIQFEWTAVTYPDDPNFDRKKFNTAIDRILSLQGNSQRGELMYKRACNLCHPNGDEGIGESLRKSSKEDKAVARIIRAGKGHMPFFSMDKLSDQDVSDIIVFLRGEIFGTKKSAGEDSDHHHE